MNRPHRQPTRSRVRASWKHAVLGLAAGVVVALGATTPATAATADSLTLSSSSANPGDVITVTVEFTTDTTPIEVLGAEFDSALSGDASWTIVSSAPPSGSCGTAGSVANCEFNGLATGTDVTMTLTLSLAPTAPAGDYVISSFANNATSTASQTLTVVGTPDTPPSIDPIVLAPMGEGTTQDVVVTATDPDGDLIALSAILLPSFATFTDNGGGKGLLHFAPGYGDSGPYGVAIEATAGKLNSKAGATLVVNDVETSPVLAPIGAQTVAEGASLTIPLSATDADGDEVTLTVSGLPGFASFAPGAPGASTSGSITVNPGVGDAGTYEITVTATGTPAAASETFTLTVTNDDQTPVPDPDVPDANSSVGSEVAGGEPSGMLAATGVASPGVLLPAATLAVLGGGILFFARRRHA